MIEVSGTPKHHPDCCLSLSSGLLSTIAESIRPLVNTDTAKTIVTSIGCGTGLFESLLATHVSDHLHGNVCITGVEVVSAKTPYLTSEQVTHVQGTWDICKAVEHATMLLFVYPRDGRLVRQYLETFYQTAATVWWLGPRADWIEQQPMLHNVRSYGEPIVVENAGLVPYEVAARFDDASPIVTLEHGDDTHGDEEFCSPVIERI